MDLFTANSTGHLPQTLPPSPYARNSTIMILCFLANTLAFLVLVINGLVLIRTERALHAMSIAYQPAPPPSQRNLYIQPNTDTDTETECALNQQDLLATAMMKRARALALFGPLLTIPTLVCMSICLHGVASDVSVRLLLPALFITVIHCANACTVQTYFSLIQRESKLTFGPEICSARQEKARSRSLMKVYLTVLFFVSFISEGDAKDRNAAALEVGWEPATTYGSGRTDEKSASTGRLPPLTDDFGDTNSVDSMELNSVDSMELNSVDSMELNSVDSMEMKRLV